MKLALVLVLLPVAVFAQDGSVELKVWRTRTAVPPGLVLPEGFSFKTHMLALRVAGKVDPAVEVAWSEDLPAPTREPTTEAGPQLYRCKKGWCLSLGPACPCTGIRPREEDPRMKVEAVVPSVEGFVLPRLKGRVWWVPSTAPCPPCRAP